MPDYGPACTCGQAEDTHITAHFPNCKWRKWAEGNGAICKPRSSWKYTRDPQKKRDRARNGDTIVSKSFYVYGRENEQLRRIAKERGITQCMLLHDIVNDFLDEN